jgi:hypothetical protein
MPDRLCRPEGRSLRRAKKHVLKINRRGRGAAPSNVHIQATMSGGGAGIVGAQNASIGSMNVGAPKPNENS